jgi:prepilin-type N-terminal cleavage/methylation domain-containing protein
LAERSKAGAGPSGEEGFTLTEILLTIVIVGIAFTALLGGMLVSITSSAYQRQQAIADTAVRDAAEVVKDSVLVGDQYVNCAGNGAYALPSVPGASISIIGVRYWKPWTSAASGSAYSLDANFVASCPSPDQGLQLITIQATSGQATETVQVIKRKTT